MSHIYHQIFLEKKVQSKYLKFEYKFLRNMMKIINKLFQY